MQDPVSQSPMLQNPVQWDFNYELFFGFEIDVTAIHLKMPRNTFPAEIRPGVGLIYIGAVSAPAGNLGHMSSFFEINWSVMVEADLSLPMPTPRLSLFTGSVGSDSQGFLEHSHTVDKLRIYRSRSLRGALELENFAVSVEDENGPILSLRSSHQSEPVFRDDTFWVQLRTVMDGAWCQAVRWSGMIYEHQQGHHVGTLHRHPFFEGIDVTGIGDRCYIQMLTVPDHPIQLTLYEPMLWGRERRTE